MALALIPYPWRWKLLQQILPVVCGAFHGSNSLWIRGTKCPTTFYLILLGWVLFRATSLPSAVATLGDLHGFGGSLLLAGPVALRVLWLTAGSVLVMHLMDLFVLHKSDKLESKPWLF